MNAAEAYESMLSIRRFEETLLDLFDRGLLNGTTHTCIGQEQIPVAYTSVLNRERDVIFSNHRGHGHFLAFTGDFYALACEIMGRCDGVCAGVGGSQHLHATNFYSNGVQGGIVGNAAGIAFAEQQRGSGAVTSVFLGDGTLGQGLVYETCNLASLWDLPIVFVVENNQYAQSTPVRLQVAGSMTARFEAFGVRTWASDSSDPLELRRVFADVVESVRSSGRPAAVVVETYRLAHHSKSDDFRDEDEVTRYRERDPLGVLEASLPAADVAVIRDRVERHIVETFERASECPLSAARVDALR